MPVCLQQAYAAMQQAYAAMHQAYATVQQAYAAMHQAYAAVHQAYAAVHQAYAVMQQAYAAVQQAYAAVQYAFAAMHRAYDCFHQACLPFWVYNLLPIVTALLGVCILSVFFYLRFLRFLLLPTLAFLHVDTAAWDFQIEGLAVLMIQNEVL